MKRRALLAALGAVGLAGCVDTPGGSDDGTTWNGSWTTRSDPATATPDPGNVTLAASPGSAALPRATIDLTLHNGANTRFVSNFYGWYLDKRVEGEWVNVSPRAVPEPLHHLEPGESRTWSLLVDNTVPATDDPDTASYMMEEIEYSGFGPGTYRFRIAGWFEHGGGSSAERRYEATFELTGDPIELRPEPATTRRDGGTLVVETDDYALSRSSLRVTATPAPDHEGEVERLITELASRYPGVRNTLPYFDREGVDRVRLFVPYSTDAVPGAGVGGGVSSYVEYEGRVYRIETEEIEKGTTHG